MAKLTINGKTVTVDDSFLKLSPDQQNATVEEIAKSLSATSTQPTANNPWAGVQQAPLPAPDGSVSSNIEDRTQPAPMAPSLAGSTAATLGGLVNGLPIIGPASQIASDALMGVGSQLTGGNYGDTVRGLQDRRTQLAAANPIASAAGNVGGALAGFGGAASTEVGARALGMSGPTMVKMGNGLLSTLGITTADNIVRGSSPVDALKDAALPALAGGIVPLVGDGVRKGAEATANAVTGAVQNRLTNAAIKGAPAAADLKSAASQLFESATGGQPLAVSNGSYTRLLDSVKTVANKFRINADNDKQSVGLLNTITRIADDAAQGGVAIDLKDLHLVRQLAQKVAQSSEGRDKAFASQVINQLDDYVKTLKPADILGGGDPAQATQNLFAGISTWSRASKVGIIEEAITKAQTYKSGTENGLRLQFQALLRNPTTRKLFNQAEIKAITDVANGTPGSNFVTLLGKFGFGTGGAGNMLGGTIGTSLGATLGSAFGPVGSFAGGALAGAGGTAARKLSERMGMNAAERAAQVVAIPDIPLARQITIPPAIAAGIPAAQLMARAAMMQRGQ